MRWSKLKKALEDLLADVVKDHLDVHFTRYGRSPSSMMDRGWVTWDKEEIYNFSTVNWLRTNRSVATLMYEAGEREELPGWRDEEVLKRLEQAEITSRDQWYVALKTYPSLSIEQAVHSPHALIRGWAMFDRRLGKRRLCSMEIKPTDPPFMNRWYQLRCRAEGIPAGSAGHDH
ncbi:MAG TPA: hypothetical protein VFV38_18360 [Ktedonobacteraceae bacterium]|nr:hypothetical protein [Ktedonobacteraceae bacterium]